MMDSPNEGISSSPTFLISQLSDPSFISSICRPFINGDIIPETFSLSYAENVLIPNVIHNINERNIDALNNIPDVAKLLVDNLGEDGLNLILQSVLPALQNCLRATSSTTSHDMMKLIGDTICSISTKYRDDVFVEVISKASSDTESKLRILAAYLIPLVHDSSRVLFNFRSLSLDRVTQVRCELLKNLPNCTFDESLLQYVLINASKDQNVVVRRAAAAIFGKVAPQKIDEFIPLLTNKETVKSALRSMKDIVIENGLTPLSIAFHDACYLEPELSAAVVLNVSRVVPDEEKRLVLKFAYLLKLTNNMITHLFKFSEIFPDKDFFVDMLEPDVVQQPWRSRRSMLEQARLFVPILGDKLARIAEIYSRDPVAMIRNLSVGLWIELIKFDESLTVDAKRLISEAWQTRLVLSKIIKEYGVSPHFEETFQILSKDEVSNVRYSAAVTALQIGVECFDKLFGECEDKDILILRNEIKIEG
ncbi:hypothetical protein TRFO_14110 [Tritrichomonas foetus]|uniref:HEAT repeat family protein n=1 Tax=Tritrichomonas foetus TaxID=1144522 RepID=A0A1J4KVV6_9EUKA|nr:hypothetical protein TRFO_14110 [Tritrichomonas foetus]|eukprot:OHT15363.1 hypothetical protein TRFO_14110 [Tritrichomonas foetus]